MAEPNTIYLVDDEAGHERAVADLVEALSERFDLKRERLARSTTYYDTFDWRLFRRGQRLTVEPGAEGLMALWTHPKGAPRRARLSREPGMASDLPPGALGDGLAKVISMRRLLPLAEVRAEGQLLRVLDRRRKTIVRLVVESRKVRRPGSKGRFGPLRTWLRLTPVKGYRRAAREATGWLDERPGLRPSSCDELEEAAAAVGIEVGGYGKRAAVALDPSLDADSAVRALLGSLMETALVNEEGLIGDVDSEFLHDFRVSVRRTRAALGQLKGVFEPARIAPLQQELSWLGKLTGPTRDLDVYLLKLPSYAEQLPEGVRADLVPLGGRLEELHREEQRALAETLSTQRYRRLKRSWARFVREAPEEAEKTARGRAPISKVAASSIDKAHRRVLRKGGAITDDSPSETLHRLRLDCKKLRYLMELFRDLFPAREMSRSIRSLKAFQDNLGDFQDYGVQQVMLRRLAHELQGVASSGPETLMAIGRLVAELEAGEARERRRFAKSFAKFSSESTVKRFRAALRGGGRR